jgi:uncharacterized paraquat-inducible protein A
MMTCGHSPNGKDAVTGKQVCVICQCDTFADAPSLEGRKASCCYGCGAKADSSEKLPFFEFKPSQKEDKFYCGCRGFD